MKNFIIRRIFKTSKYSFQGLISAWNSEEAFKVEVILFFLILPFAFFLGESALEVSILIMSLMIVLIVELLNTGLEKVVDRISTEPNSLSKFVKDVGSAAVLIAILQAAIVWILFLFK